MWGFLLPLVFILYMPQTVINRRCGCKGSDNGWVVNCGATAVTPGNCTVTSDCKGTCTDAKGSDSAVYKPNRRKDIEYDMEDMGYEMNEQDLTRLIGRVVTESKHGSSYMAKKQLWSIADKAEDMAKRLPDNTQLEDWMESHIAKADSMMDSVYDSFDYDNQMDIPGFEGTMDALDNLTINEDKFWKEVKIKDKCKTFPYCSEGAVDSPLEYPGRKKKRSKRKKSSKNKYHNIGKWISENEINHLIKRVINKV